MMLLAALAIAAQVHATYADVPFGSYRLIVDGYERGVRKDDYQHQVFVALTDKNDRELGRVDVTKYLVEGGEPGRVAEVRAQINMFEMRGGDYADVVLWSVLSGTGAISTANDLFFRVRNGKLTFLGSLQGTESFARSGVGLVHQTQSELSATASAIVWIKRARTAKGDHIDCRTTRTTYRVKGSQLVVSTELAGKIGLTRLPRLGLKEIVPCRH